MKADGTIEGVDYLIEKTRLFGSGGFGSITLTGTTATRDAADRLADPMAPPRHEPLAP